MVKQKKILSKERMVPSPFHWEKPLTVVVAYGGFGHLRVSTKKCQIWAAFRTGHTETTF